MLSWFRKKEQRSSPDQEFARAVRLGVHWWLLLLRDHSGAEAEDAAAAELALEYFREGAGIRRSICELAAVQLADMIQRAPPEARSECLTYMEGSSDCQTLWELNVVESITGADTAGPNVLASLLETGAAVAARDHYGRLYSDERLTPAANRLYVGVRHLWERAVAALSLEPTDAALRGSVNWLLVETIMALEGLDTDQRRTRRAEALT